MFMQISAGWCHQLSRKPNQCTVVLKSNLILLVPTVECLSFTVQGLTLQGCFRISLLNVYIFSVVIKNMICSRTSMICDITNTRGNSRPRWVHTWWEWTLCQIILFYILFMRQKVFSVITISGKKVVFSPRQVYLVGWYLFKNMIQIKIWT